MMVGIQDVYACTIDDVVLLAESIYAINLIAPEISGCAIAGQFVTIKCGESNLLRRPLSICRAGEGKISLVFEIKGEGTEWLSMRYPGERINVLGPLGNGFDIPDGNIITVGGGIGAPPLLFAAETAKGSVTAVLGFRGAGRIILKDLFDEVCDDVLLATDDGSSGIRGTVITPLRELLVRGAYDAVLACGPRVMLRAVADICNQHNVPCQVSLEERMACGVGACIVCACATKKGGVASMSRVCVEGPVFAGDEVVW